MATTHEQIVAAYDAYIAENEKLDRKSTRLNSSHT